MFQTKEYSIKSCDDFELNIKRKSKLNFKLTYDDSKEIKALLVFIPGCGGDANTSYKDHLPISVAKELSVAVLMVDYFGISNRPFLGGKCMLDDFDKEFFKYSCNAVGFRLDDDFDERAKYINTKESELGINKNQKNEYLDTVIDNLNLHIGMLKLSGKAKMDYRMHLLFTLEAKNDEYQNFGLMPCVDIINAILHVKSSLPFNLAEAQSEKYLPSVLIGSSHGGYLANLCAKIAPWLIDGIIDNSSWNLKASMLEDMNYEAFKTIGFAKKIDLVNLSRLHANTENFAFHYNDKTLWDCDKNSPFYCSASRLDIRDVANVEHLKKQIEIKKYIYRGYHSSKDDVAPFALKKEFWEKLKKLKFDCQTNAIKTKSQIDGKFIKSLEHGLDMSLKTLILKETPPLLELLKNSGEYKGKKEISYATDEWIYSFKENKNKLIPSCQKA